MIAIDLSRKKLIDAAPKEAKQINFIRNLDQKATIFFIIKESKETILDFRKKL